MAKCDFETEFWRMIVDHAANQDISARQLAALVLDGNVDIDALDGLSVYERFLGNMKSEYGLSSNLAMSVLTLAVQRRRERFSSRKTLNG
jgi:predicted DNA-binding ribbon-helix-helix protein